MKMSSVFQTLQAVLRGYGTLASQVSTKEMLTALNAAANVVADELQYFLQVTCAKWHNEEGQEAGDSEPFAYADFLEIDENTEDFPLPSYAAMAVVYYAAAILSEKSGEFERGAEKNMTRLFAMYKTEMDRAKRSARMEFAKNIRKVKDAWDPDRFDRAEW